MFNEGPPSRDDVTTSLTCPESTDVKTLTNSGISAPASVPHVMTVESFHHIVPSPRSLMSRYDTMYVMATDTSEVSQTSEVSGASKFILSALPYRALATASFRKYDRPLAMIIITRIAKIHTSNSTWIRSPRTAIRMNVMSATPVTP